MRVDPSLFQYDYLVLTKLAAAITRLIPRSQTAGGLALDVGADASPYRASLEAAGYEVKTLDLTVESGADYAGTAEKTGLPDEAFDLLICTQVLEHVPNPWGAVTELRRILKPGGFLLLSVPHVWFYHPHPGDYWRMTGEGVRHLCTLGRLECRRLEAQGNSVTSFFQVVNFLLYGAVGRLGAPLFAAVNLTALAAERLTRDERFAMNFACLAQRTS